MNGEKEKGDREEEVLGLEEECGSGMIHRWI
jgi:hypothetical protein